MRSFPSGTAALSAAVAVAVLLTGCGGSNSAEAPNAAAEPSADTSAPPAADAAGTPAPTPASESAGTACDLVTPADIKAVAGVQPAAGQLTDGGQRGITVCNYPEAFLLVRFSPEIGKAEAAAAKDANANPVPGLGDDAYWFKTGPDSGSQTGLSVVRGDAQIYLLSGTMTFVGLRPLAEKALTRL